MKRASLRLLPGLFLLAGCVPNQLGGGLPTVGSNQIGTPPPYVAARMNLPPADTVLADRVDSVGRDLLFRNKNHGLDPNLTFATYPSSSVEIFHPNRSQVIVTEGLARQCNAEQMTAVLANELGKIAAERIAAAPYLDNRNPEGPPIFSPIGSDKSVSQSAMFEFARYDAQQPPRKQPLPDPRQLAHAFLEKAGYGKASLDAVQQLLEEAGRNQSVAMHVKGLTNSGIRATSIPPKSNWLP
jgi:hypothetical protein